MNFRASAEDAGWSLREAAWGIEENVLWRGGDATRDAMERAGRRLLPLQRLIQTRLTWPVEDRAGRSQPPREGGDRRRRGDPGDGVGRGRCDERGR